MPSGIIALRLEFYKLSNIASYVVQTDVLECYIVDLHYILLVSNQNTVGRAFTLRSPSRKSSCRTLYTLCTSLYFFNHMHS